MRVILFRVLLLVMPVMVGAMQWSSQLEVEGRIGGFRRGGGVNLFCPFQQGNRAVSFVQGTGGHWLDNWTGAGGIGYRAMYGQIGLGVNGFIDYDYTANHRSFWQGGVGAEFLAPCFEARINGYIPFTIKRTIGNQASLFLQGIDLWRRDFNLVERSYRGFEAEMGYGYHCLRGVVWSHVGYYDFTANRNPDIRGPRLRLTYQLDRLLGHIGAFASAGVVWEYDAVHKGKVAAELSIQVPIGRPGKAARCSLTSVRRRMGFPVQRINSTLVKRQQQPELVSSRPVLSPDGLQRQVFFATAAGAGGGTQVSPTNAAGAQALSRPYDFIIPLADGGALPLASTFALKANQTLVGFGDSSSLVLAVDGASLTLFNGSGRPTLTGGGFPTITLGQSNVVQGLAIAGGTDGIFGINQIGTTVRDVNITGVTDDGIELTNATGTLIEDVTVTTSGDFGLLFGVAALDTTLRRVTVSGTPDDGILVTNGTNTLMEDITLTTVGDFGIQFVGSATDTVIRRASITGTTNDGILMADTRNTLIEDTTLRAIGDFGIQIIGSATDTTIRRVVIDTVADDGILIADGSNTLIERTTISNVTNGPGIFMAGSSRRLSVIDSTIANVTGGGIQADDSSDTVISNVSMSNIGGFGVFLNDSSSRSRIQNVRIDDTNSTGVFCENCFDLVVRDSTLTNIGNSGGDFGIFLINARDSLLQNNRIDTVTDDGINVITGNNLEILDTTITRAVSRGIDLTNVTGNIRLQGNTITDITGGGNFGIECINTTTVNEAFYQIADNTIIGNGTAGGFTTTDTGISLLSTGGARVRASVAGNELRGLDGFGILALKGGASPTSVGLLDVVMTHNRLTDLDTLQAISVQAQSTSDNAQVNYRVAGNIVNNVNGQAMLFRHDATVGGTVGPVIMKGSVNNNTVIDTAGLFAETDMEDNPAHSFTLCLNDNAFINTRAQAIRVNADSSSFGALNITACSNTDNGSVVGLFGYDFEAEATFTGSYCLTLKNNNSTRPAPAIQVENDAVGGTFEVTDLANLSAINNDIGVSTAASTAPIIDRTVPCPGCTCNLP